MAKRQARKNNPAFIKFDGDKNRLDLLVPEFIEAMGWVLTAGARKYAEENWKNGERKRYMAALLRHSMQRHGGEVFDKELNLPHTACIAINAMFLYYLDIHGEGNAQKDMGPKRKEGSKERAQARDTPTKR